MLGAIAADESLTPLGALLVALPMEPRLAKLVLMGVVFGAVDEALTIATALAGSRSPFLTPMENMEARSMATARSILSDGTQSDHIAALNAYRRYFSLPTGIRGDRRAFAQRMHLAPDALDDMRALKAQLLEILADAKLVSSRMRDLAYTEEFAFRRAAEAAAAEAAGEAPPEAPTNYGMFTPSTELISALVGAAFHPQLAYVADAARDVRGRRGDAPRAELHIREVIKDATGPPGAPKASKASKAAAATARRVVARVHPAAVGSRLNSSGWGSPYIAFHECLRTTQLFVRDATPTPPLAPLLFSGCELTSTEAVGGKDMLLDDWLCVELSANAAPLVTQARTHVQARWERMVSDAARGGGLGGRFDGQPLLEAVQPLLEQRAIRLAPPAAPAVKRRAGKKGLKVTRRRKRSQMARFRYDRAGKYW